MNSTTLLLGLLVALAAGRQLASASLLVLDKNLDALDMDKVAAAVCESAGRVQLARISTIDRLIEHFSQRVGPSNDLYYCKSRILEPLRQLKLVLAASQQNVCSPEKVALIESYHRKFVSSNELDIDQRSRDHKQGAPKLLKLFFMHYATRVALVCKRNLMHNFDNDLPSKFQGIERLASGSLADCRGPHCAGDQVFRQTIRTTMDMAPINDFDEVILPWELLKKTGGNHSGIESSRILDDTFDLHGQPIKLRMKLKFANQMRSIRHACLARYRPIYEKLILPVVRLSNLGYTGKFKELREDKNKLPQHDVAQFWYAVTRLCEILIPIRFHTDPSLQPDEVVIMKDDSLENPINEFDQTYIDPSELRQYEPDTNSLVGVDYINSVESKEARALVAKINLRLSSKDRQKRKVVLLYIYNLKYKIKNMFSRLVLPKKKKQSEQILDDEQYVRTNIKDLLAGSGLHMVISNGGIPNQYAFTYIWKFDLIKDPRFLWTLLFVSMTIGVIIGVVIAG